MIIIIYFIKGIKLKNFDLKIRFSQIFIIIVNKFIALI